MRQSKKVHSHSFKSLFSLLGALDRIYLKKYDLVRVGFYLSGDLSDMVCRYWRFPLKYRAIRDVFLSESVEEKNDLVFEKEIVNISKERSVKYGQWTQALFTDWDDGVITHIPLSFKNLRISLLLFRHPKRDPLSADDSLEIYNELSPWLAQIKLYHESQLYIDSNKEEWLEHYRQVDNACASFFEQKEMDNVLDSLRNKTAELYNPDFTMIWLRKGNNLEFHSMKAMSDNREVDSMIERFNELQQTWTGKEYDLNARNLPGAMVYFCYQKRPFFFADVPSIMHIKMHDTDFNICKLTKQKQMLISPIMDNMQVRGAIWMGWTHNTSTFSSNLNREQSDEFLRLCKYASYAMENANLYSAVEHQASHDFLTDLANRSVLQGSLDRRINECYRSKKPLSILVIDIDFFKNINDTYGHATGDEVLKSVAHYINDKPVGMQGLLRKMDLACRWGGEEFVILLPLCNKDGAMKVAERIRSGIAGYPVSIINSSGVNDTVSVTVSIGVAEYDGSDQLSGDELFHNADSALYEAKQSGRNCCKVYEERGK